jgi:hypothetical protein
VSESCCEFPIGSWWAFGQSSRLLEAEFGNAASGRRNATAALTLAPDSGIKELATLALARAGNVAEAQTIADELNGDFALHYDTPGLLAACDSGSDRLNRKNPARSIDLLQTTASYELGNPEPLLAGSMYPADLRGQAYLLLAAKARRPLPSFRKLSTTGRWY